MLRDQKCFKYVCKANIKGTCSRTLEEFANCNSSTETLLLVGHHNIPIGEVVTVVNCRHCGGTHEMVQMHKTTRTCSFICPVIEKHVYLNWITVQNCRRITMV